MRNKKGLTIIEVIVVLFLIVLLYMLLLPQIHNGSNRHIARSLICSNNLKQLGLIYQLYCNDNQQKFLEIEDVSNQGKWLSDLEPYFAKKSNLIICPTAKGPRIKDTEYGGPRSSYKISVKKEGAKEKSLEGSYGINSWVYNPVLNSNIVSTYPKENFCGILNNQNPTKVPLIADSIWVGGFPEPNGIAGQPPDENGQWDNIDAAMKHFCIDRHSSRTNVVFMDGHVDRVELKKLWKLKWHKNFDIGGPWTKPDAAWPEWLESLK